MQLPDRVETANPVILALDAAGAACSAALWRDGGIRGRRFEAMSRGQSERLVPMIQETLDEAKTAFGELDGIAVTVGPGGFTGVRIGLATARGLALACQCPVIGFSNFLALAAAARAEVAPEQSLAVLIDAKRPDLYAQAFDARLSPLTGPTSVDPADLNGKLPNGPLLLVGDGVPQVQAALLEAGRDLTFSRASGLSDAAHVARLAAQSGLPGRGAPPPRPLYLRPPDVTLPALGR